MDDNESEICVMTNIINNNMNLYFSQPFVDVNGSDMTALRLNFNYISP